MDKLVDYYLTPISPYVYLGHAALRRDRPAPRCDGRRQADQPRARVSRVGRRAADEAGAAAPGVSPRRACALVAPSRRAAQPAPEALSGVGRDRVALDPGGARAQHRRRARACGALGRALWAEDRDIADAATVTAIAATCGADAAALAARADAPDIATRYAVLTQEAIDRGIFGAPTYVYARRALLGTGSARLFGPRTGKIASFGGRGPSTGPAATKNGPARTPDGRTRRRGRPQNGFGGAVHDITFPRGRVSMSNPLIFALVCAIAAIVYGAVSIQWILAKPAGNPRMQEIAAAIQAGRQGLPEPPVHDDRHRRRDPLPRHRRVPELDARRAASRSAPCCRVSPATSA